MFELNTKKGMNRKERYKRFLVKKKNHYEVRRKSWVIPLDNNGIINCEVEMYVISGELVFFEYKGNRYIHILIPLFTVSWFGTFPIICAFWQRKLNLKN